MTGADVFFLVLFIGDFFIGISQKENSLIVSPVMSIIFSALIFAINKRK